MTSNEFKDLRRRAVAQGWVIAPTKGGHLKFIPPDPTKSFYIVAVSPSDRKVRAIVLCELRKRGFDDGRRGTRRDDHRGE